jgi:hypothetical protein
MEVAAMNVESFVVRSKRRFVEKYARVEAWTVLLPEALTELAHEVAGLPAELDPESEESNIIGNPATARSVSARATILQALAPVVVGPASRPDA